MSKFSLYLPLLESAEGGYQKLANDSGNYNSLGELVGTNFGISAPVYEDWIGRPPTEADMRRMSKATSVEIYKKLYWNIIGANYIKNQSIANIIVDHGVNAGVGAAGKLVQRVLNNKFGYNLAVDGAIGSKTRAAINAVNQNELHDALLVARKAFYETLNNRFWLPIWLNRLGKFVFTEKKKPQSDYLV
jgi:lysozyme family protein